MLVYSFVPAYDVYLNVVVFPTPQCEVAEIDRVSRIEARDYGWTAG